MFKANGRKIASEQANKKDLRLKKFKCSECGLVIFKDGVEFGEKVAPCVECAGQMNEVLN